MQLQKRSKRVFSIWRSLFQQIKEEEADRLRDKRMERCGVDGNTNYRKAQNLSSGPTGGKKKKYDGMSAVEKVRADIEKKYGKGAIMDTKKKKDKKEDKK